MSAIGYSVAVKTPGLPGSEARGFLLDDIGPRLGGDRRQRQQHEV